DVVEAGQPVGEGTHVAAALHVVLPADRHQPGAVAADVAGEQGQADQGEDVVAGGVVLGDPQRPAQLGGGGGGVCDGHLPDGIGGDAGDLLRPGQVVLGDLLGIGVEAGRRPFDELAVVETLVDDHLRHGVGQGDVGTDVDAEPHVGPLGRFAAPR